jgi:hypothetical protein
MSLNRLFADQPQIQPTGGVRRRFTCLPRERPCREAAAAMSGLVRGMHPPGRRATPQRVDRAAHPSLLPRGPTPQPRGPMRRHRLTALVPTRSLRAPPRGWHIASFTQSSTPCIDTADMRSRARSNNSAAWRSVVRRVPPSPGPLRLSGTNTPPAEFSAIGSDIRRQPHPKRTTH